MGEDGGGRVSEELEAIRKRCANIKPEDWAAVGEDFRVVGDDIRKAMKELDAILEKNQ